MVMFDLQQGREICIRICEALGLSADKVRTIDIHLSVQGLATITVEGFLDVNEMGNAVKVFEAVL